MSPLWSSYRHPIRDECAYVMDTVAPLTFETFHNDRTWSRSVVRSLEIIGEATKHLPIEVLVAHPGCPGSNWPVCGIGLPTAILTSTWKSCGRSPRRLCPG